jgi:hypothetical protein
LLGNDKIKDHNGKDTILCLASRRFLDADITALRKAGEITITTTISKNNKDEITLENFFTNNSGLKADDKITLTTDKTDTTNKKANITTSGGANKNASVFANDIIPTRLLIFLQGSGGGGGGGDYGFGGQAGAGGGGGGF